MMYNRQNDLDALIDEMVGSGDGSAKRTSLPLDRIHPFPDHPYQVRDDEEMESLTESVREQGVLTPLLVRRIDGSSREYEVISGHRRLFAAGKAGLKEVPVIVTDMDRASAAIALVDSNLHREHIFPSEKAFAYRMKMEALSHQGQTSGQVGQKWSREQISETESGRQVQRYLRLTCLIPEILQMVDEGRIALTPAVELSFLSDTEQRLLFRQMEADLSTPSLSQAQRLRRMHAVSPLTEEEISQIMSEIKGNQKDFVRIPYETLCKVIPRDYRGEKTADFIVKACEYYRKHLERQRNGR